MLSVKARDHRPGCGVELHAQMGICRVPGESVQPVVERPSIRSSGGHLHVWPVKRVIRVSTPTMATPCPGVSCRYRGTPRVVLEVRCNVVAK